MGSASSKKSKRRNTADGKANGKSPNATTDSVTKDTRRPEASLATTDRITAETAQDSKLRTVFLSIDNDGNARINRSEFRQFLNGLGVKIDDKQADQFFDGLDKDKNQEIYFEEFYDPFLCIVRGEEENSTATCDLDDDLKENLLLVYKQTDANQLKELLTERWKAFDNFDRRNKDGRQVMTGAEGIVADVVPGHYRLRDLVYFKDLSRITPKFASVKGVTWEKSNTEGRSGWAVFPEDFDGNVPTEAATNELLHYYGASIADGNEEEVTLTHRHGIQDFTYGDNYMEDWVASAKGLNGSGMERHKFHHMDCPLEEDSGTFLMAKWAGEDELHMTGFKVPVRHTLYLPGNLIHSNDYLKGPWRTMLSDESGIDHVKFVRAVDNGNKKEKFVLIFD